MPEYTSLATALYHIGAVQFGDFTLKSGQQSSIYINLRKIISYPLLLRLIANAMWEKVQHCSFDLICGVPYTALPIATCMSIDHDIPMIMRRKEKKEYGTKQMIEGVFAVGQRCLIVEDIITTGSSILETARDLEKEQLQITDVIALIDREQGGRSNLSQFYQVHTLLTLRQILSSLQHQEILNDEERNIVDQLLENLN